MLNNPSLSELKINKTIISDTASFNIHKMVCDESMDKYSPYVEYICSIIDFYCHICMSRNEDVFKKLIEMRNFEFSMQEIWAISKDTRVPLKIRIKFIKLVKILYIDINPFERISSKKNRCYFFSDFQNKNCQTLQIKDRQNSLDYNEKELFDLNFHRIFRLEVEPNTDNNLSSILDYVLKFWSFDFSYSNELLIYSLDKFKSIKVSLNFLKFCNQIFNLTHILIDFGLFNKSKIDKIFVGIGHFFSVFEIYNSQNKINEHRDKQIIQHWLRKCAAAIAEIDNNEVKNKLFKLYQKSSMILFIISKLRQDSLILQ